MKPTQQAYYETTGTLTGSSTSKVLPDVVLSVKRDIALVGFDVSGRALNTYNSEDFPYIYFLVNCGFQTSSNWVEDDGVPRLTCQSNGAVSFFNASGSVSPGNHVFEVIGYSNNVIAFDVTLYLYLSLFYNVL